MAHRILGACLKRVIAVLLAGVALDAAPAGAQVAAPPDSVVQGECLSCHGPLGHPADPGIPIIGGQHADYLVQALKAYQTGGRNAPSAVDMIARAKALSDADVQAAAEFFSNLRSVRW